MDIGIKIYPEGLEFAKKIAKYCDFFEVMAIPGENFHALKILGKPFTIHTIHSKWGFNPANPAKLKINNNAVITSQKAADILHADKIVVHPGHLETKECSVDNAVSFIKTLDSRFIVENMPGLIDDFHHLGRSKDELKHILQKTKKGMCLDFAHAAEYAHSRNIDCIGFVKSFMELKPTYFHISDTRIQTKNDSHLHLKEGNLNLWYFKRIVPKNSSILIETPHDFDKQRNDILLLRK